MLLQGEGANTDYVGKLESNWRDVCAQPRVHHMLRFAEKMTRDATQICEDDVQILREVGFSDADVLDIVHVTCLFNYMDRLADALGVELDEVLKRGGTSA
jgi:uncharacterized peroxidase-related enzyme